MSSLVQTLAPPAPVASPMATIWPIPWSAMPAAKMSPHENVLALTTATTGPRYACVVSVAAFRVADRQVLGELLAEIERGADGSGPVGEVGAVAVGLGERGHRRRGAQREPDRLDRLPGEQLQQSLGGVDDAAGVRPQVDDQPFRGRSRRTAATSSMNRVAVLDVEGPQPQVADGPVCGAEPSRRNRVGERRSRSTPRPSPRVGSSGDPAPRGRSGTAACGPGGPLRWWRRRPGGCAARPPRGR